MTERRPHWDDELIEEVHLWLIKVEEVGFAHEDIYAVIAAIEDWQFKKRMRAKRIAKAWHDQHYQGPCEWEERDPSNKPFCLKHGSWGGIDAHACVLFNAESRAANAEAVIQRVRAVLERYAVVPYSEMSQTDALGAIGKALDGDA